MKAHGTEHLMLGIAWRSLDCDNHLILSNDMIIPALQPNVEAGKE